ncbi:MAG: ABC transporter permease [Desulfobacterales bacterium]
MQFNRLWTLFVARNREFLRDRAAFGWNFLFPVLIIGGFGLIFGGDRYAEYKVGVFPVETENAVPASLDIPEQFRRTQYIQFVGFKTADEAFDKLKHYRIDFLIKAGPPPYPYWLNNTSPKGYIVEKIFRSSLLPPGQSLPAQKNEISGRQIRYVDWFFPGILTMNMMFSALWGVGYVVVRYRKNGVLKRLKATPLTAFEYLSAQMLSRIFLLMFTLAVVWIGCDLIFSFHVEGSYVDLAVVFFVGSLSLTALGLVIASRGTSEEFATGLLNFIAWPMMFLSEVWFSIEGAPYWVKSFANIFPLTHLLKAVRKIMNDGAGLIDVGPELAVLALMTLAFLAIGAWLFSWNR